MVGYNNEREKRVETYKQLLKTNEWVLKRKQVYQKDKFQCTICKVWQTINLLGMPFTVKQLGSYTTGTPALKFLQGKKHISLHAHHSFYVLERLPWQYDNEHLISLCGDCHTKVHLETKIPVYLTEYDRDMDIMSDLVPCPKCGGDGYIDAFDYHENGVCFKCMGECFIRIWKN